MTDITINGQKLTNEQVGALKAVCTGNGYKKNNTNIRNRISEILMLMTVNPIPPTQGKPMTDTQDLIKRAREAASNAPNHQILRELADALAAHQEVLQSFVDNQIEYMRVNNLGDGEKQYNVKWARKVMGPLPPKED